MYRPDLKNGFTALFAENRLLLSMAFFLFYAPFTLLLCASWLEQQQTGQTEHPPEHTNADGSAQSPSVFPFEDVGLSAGVLEAPDDIGQKIDVQTLTLPKTTIYGRVGHACPVWDSYANMHLNDYRHRYHSFGIVRRPLLLNITTISSLD